MKQRLFPILLLLTTFVLLDACTGTATRPAHQRSIDQRAERAYARGDFEQAAGYWQQASEQAPHTQVDELRVKAADAWLRSKHPEEAANLLSRVNKNLLDQQGKSLFYLVSASLALRHNDTRKADFYLQAAARRLPHHLQSLYKELHNRLQAAQRLAEGRNLAKIEDLTNSIVQYQPERVLEILRALEAVTSGQLHGMVTRAKYRPEFTTWLELALQIRSAILNPASIATAAKNWSASHPGHVINQTDFSDTAARYRAVFSSPAQVAVLLPAQGALADAGKAIRDGILAAYFEQPGHSRLRFYNSGDNPEAATAAYLHALQDGAGQVIGPLRIDSTRHLGKHALGTVPVLLLNDSPATEQQNTQAGTRVTSLTLSQSQEAGVIADQVLAQAHNRAIIVVPDNSWGTRIQTAFTQRFEAGNGRVVGMARFNATDNDAMLTRLLRIDASLQRKQDLQAQLGISLNFEPHRRHDFDFIFLAATPAQGRQIKPLLRFHDAGAVPVYAMGRIYSGHVDRTSDQDLNGIIFPITHWQLQAVTNNKTIPPESVRGGTLANLYALGQDAWQIVRWLPLLQKDPDLEYPGETGSLHMQRNGHLYRQPEWAQFLAGRPIRYQWSVNQ